MLFEATPSSLVNEMQLVVAQHIPLIMLHNRHGHKTQPKNVQVSEKKKPKKKIMLDE